MATQKQFQRTCNYLEKLLENRRLDCHRYKLHRLSVGILLEVSFGLLKGGSEGDIERAEKLLARIKDFNDKYRKKLHECV